MTDQEFAALFDEFRQLLTAARDGMPYDRKRFNIVHQRMMITIMITINRSMLGPIDECLQAS